MISETECLLEIPTPKIPTWTRGSRLKLAILASIGSKLVTVVLQFLVVPLAIRALGAERYGVYAMLTSSLGWITLVGVGISPSLTIAIAAARGDSRKEAGYLTSALCITGAISTVILAALGILVGATASSAYSEATTSLIAKTYALDCASSPAIC